MSIISDIFVSEANAETINLIPLTKEILTSWVEEEGKDHKAWVELNKFKAEAASILMIPNDEAGLRILVGIDENEPHWSWGGVAAKLPTGRYCLPEDMDQSEQEDVLLGWALGQYAFDRYKTKKKEDFAELVLSSEFDPTRAHALAEGIMLARDLINTPAADMGPAELAEEASKLAKTYSGECNSIIGEKLLEQNFPMIHAVGRAAAKGREPRLIEIKWGSKDAPKITLVGKGVCFDTGGLDLKGSQYMLTMKKDMGGSANVLGLAKMIMATNLNVNLTVLIPAVENSVSADSYRPMDVLNSRNGTTVEVGNTDAEGRLVLADALTYAGEDEPDLILDMATLTGAARVALGTDMPALFCNDDKMADGILENTDSDPMWRMPLHAPYKKLMDNKTADISNISAGGYGGAITAALFLEHFVPKGQSWAHIDLMAWNLSGKPGRPEGGEAQGIRAIFAYLEKCYG